MGVLCVAQMQYTCIMKAFPVLLHLSIYEVTGLGFIKYPLSVLLKYSLLSVIHNATVVVFHWMNLHYT